MGLFYSQKWCFGRWEQSKITHGQRTRGGLRWRKPSVCYFFVTPSQQSPLNSSASITILLHLQHPATSMRNALGEEDERGKEGQRVRPLRLPTADLMRGGGGGARRPGAEPSRAESEWGRSWCGDKLEDRGNFLVLYSPHSRQMTNSR